MGLVTAGYNVGSRSPLFTELPGVIQVVEKVVVGPVSGPKEAQNKAKTLHKRSI